MDRPALFDGSIQGPFEGGKGHDRVNPAAPRPLSHGRLFAHPDDVIHGIVVPEQYLPAGVAIQGKGKVRMTDAGIVQKTAVLAEGIAVVRKIDGRIPMAQ